MFVTTGEMFGGVKHWQMSQLEGKILMDELHVLQSDSKKIMSLLAGFLISNFANFSHFNIFIHTVFVHY